MTKLKSNRRHNLAGLGIVSEKLTEDNFISWKNCLTNYLVGNGLWGVVSAQEIEPDKTNKQEHEKWKKKNALALHAIQLSCGQAIYSKFKNADINANYVWTQLAEQGDHDKESRVEDNGLSEYLEYGPLYEAIEKGNWHDIEGFFQEKKLPFTESVSSHKETALHMATLSGQTEIAKKLVKLMGPKEFELKNEHGATTFSFAAICGATELAKEMVSKNEELVTIETAGQEYGELPVMVAALYRQKGMVHYLYNKTPKDVLSPEKGANGVTLLNYLISADIYDVALLLLEKYPQLGVIPDVNDNYALKLLAQRPSAFPSGTELSFWEKLIYYCVRVHEEHVEMQTSSTSHDYKIQIPESNDEDLVGMMAHGGLTITTRALELVRKLGWVILRSIVPGIRYIYRRKSVHVQVRKFLRIVFKKMLQLSKPELEKMDLDKIINDAIKNGIFELIDEMIKSLQMQRELQWFKEVGSMVQPKLKEELNSHNKTPKILFTEEHEKLAKKAEDWMKNTAGSSMIVATLIAAVMFTTAFTVPGGNKNDTGMPTMLETQRIPFLIFMISNALSMFSSSTSLLIFLGILTARYAEDDFLKSLPTKLISGLTSLFLSIVTMMASFGSALYLILHENLSWVTVPIIVLTTIPIVLFSILQFPLLIEMTQRTYGAGIFDEYTKKSHFAKFRACLIRRNPLRKKRH
ncbi:ankyrin repeat-containing ITN1-like isoform X2 [Olea europaea subsp. europaea]|uniref:Ankyrin repeat-containing ITN1-like isoform X2 n=1 Tax=Olea europaea subsp. europaea TaxID=158383 RepID=A0A8S0VMY3_OLEEU|nr:ankyrin repeat-containing ITN1-like isoform X2 [Olea europaea subsp. europaea]